MQHSGILIVDDESVIAEELCEFLSSFDYSCQKALSVDEALGLIEKDITLTLILTDMRMPGRDGAELIQILQNMPGRDFEYLMISGRGKVFCSRLNVGSLILHFTIHHFVKMLHSIYARASFFSVM